MDLKKIEKLFPMTIEKYERFIPDISEGDIITKMNDVIQYLNRIGHISSDVVGNWNVVMKWVLNEGLTEETAKKINEMVDSGLFDQLVSESQAGWKAEVDTQLAQNAKNVVTILPNGTDDTTAIQSVLDVGDIPRLVNGIYIVSSLTLNDNAKIMSHGYKTTLKQKQGVPEGKRIIVIQGDNVSIDAMSYEGNISSDTGEQNHAVYLLNSTKSIMNIEIKGVKAKNIRVDAFTIGGRPNANPTNVRVGNIYAENCYRNGISLTGGINVTIGDVVATNCGVIGVDLESDTSGGWINNIKIGNIITSNLCILGAGNNYPFTENVEIGFVQCRKSRMGSTPNYPALDTDKDGVTFRNARNIKIKGLDIDGFERFAINFMGNIGSGDRYNDNVEIESLTVANCSITDTSYSAYLGVGGVNVLKLKNVNSTIQTGKTLIKGSSKTVNEQNVIIENAKHSGGSFASYCGLYGNNLNIVSDTIAVQSLKTLSRIKESTINGTRIIGYSDNVIIEGSTLTWTTSLELTGINIFKNNIINGAYTA